MKRIIAACMSLALLFGVCAECGADTVKNVTEAAAAYITEGAFGKNSPTVGGEWTVIALARSGEAVPEGYFDVYYKELENYLRENNGVLSERKNTEYSRTIIALRAIGKNPENAAGYNLIAPLADYEKTVSQGINGAVWALIALDCGGYEIPKNTSEAATRGKYIEKILSGQNTDGGWGFSEGSVSGADMTAMALTALSNYLEQAEVSEAVERGIEYLSAVQNENGGFSDSGAENAESAAQVIIALTTLGISPEEERFVKNGKTVESFMMSFYDGNGGFRHSAAEAQANPIATEQCFCAAAALARCRRGEAALYDMSEVKGTDTPEQSMELFSDISASFARKEITELAERKIINGRTAEEFCPEQTITRAEFTAIAARALSLPDENAVGFSDVLPSDWFYSSVSAAYSAGLVNGISETEFNPYGLITREETAVMLCRAAALCGIAASHDEAAAADILSGLDDGAEVSGWAREAAAFCIDKNIFPKNESRLKPGQASTRAETAYMLYNILELAGLL